MGKFSLIEWCHHTFNAWVGCFKVSPGCEHCYATIDTPARISRAQGVELWGKNAARKIKAESGWNEPLAWDRAAAKAGERHRVFAMSQGDVFEDREDLIEPRKRLFDLISETPNLDWLLLTKRPENVLRLTYDAWCKRVPGHVSQNEGDGRAWDWPANVWLGTSVEDQQRADERIPHLLAVPAAVRFLSMEPLLASVDLRKGIYFHGGARVMKWGNRGTTLEGISWVIVGGESGPHARPMNPQWAREIRDQCFVAEVPFFFKQWGEYAPLDAIGLPNDRIPEYTPVFSGVSMSGPAYVFRVGKKAAGRLLDGREWNELPTIGQEVAS
ncbi:MAG: phage Gp37/Gp68 family protein [Gemmatimonadota bacterium]|nr:phage Gp37/Gp68 family protein [Gemmatimonadota bacterium]